MLSNKSFLCLDLGAGSVKVAEFEATEAALVLRQYGIKSLGIEGSQESKREAALLKAIQELLSTRGFKGKQINICAPGFHVFSKFVKLPPVDTSKVTQIIQYEAQQNVPFPLEEVVWDYQIMGSTSSGELEVLLVAIKSDVVESLFRTADAAGLRVQLVDASPAALCNSFRFNYGDLEGCAMLLDIGAKTSNILFFEKGKVYARSINIGANAITQDFVAEAKMAWAKAEELKINEGFVSLGGAYEEPENPHQAAISKIARQVLTRLHIQVNQTIQYFKQQGGSVPQRVFLAGGGSVMAYTQQFFQEKLNVEVEYFNPFRNVQLDPSIDIEELAKVAHGFGEVVGLGLRNMAQCPVELNLVPKSIRQKQAFDQKKPYFIAAIASLILVVFAYGWFYGKVIAVKQASLASLSEKLQPLQQKAEQLDAQQGKINQTQAEVDQLAQYLNDRFFWAEALAEMRKLLVNVENKATGPGREVGVWVETFGTVAQDDIPTEEEQVSSGPTFSAQALMYMLQNPELAKRYGLIPGGSSGGTTGESAAAPVKPKGPANTNLVTINMKLRAVNLNKGGDSSANGNLAFLVQEEFKESTLFDSDGTKLSGDLEQVDSSAETFTFGMTLKLKSPMKL
ncbi:MAG: type IV pilus assembly protein PilM [Verrucomicrobiota bacterium]|nr:type IV pilus assembly protein PilM [Verrucomicrobiota bacterium]